jgi:hypothetical protein
MRRWGTTGATEESMPEDYTAAEPPPAAAPTTTMTTTLDGDKKITKKLKSSFFLRVSLSTTTRIRKRTTKGSVELSMHSKINIEKNEKNLNIGKYI